MAVPNIGESPKARFKLTVEATNAYGVEGAVAAAVAVAVAVAVGLAGDGTGCRAAG